MSISWSQQIIVCKKGRQIYDIWNSYLRCPPASNIVGDGLSSNESNFRAAVKHLHIGEGRMSAGCEFFKGGLVLVNSI